MTILLGIFLFGVLIFVHELGHFLTAKLFGIRVHDFSVGMGPAIWKKERGGTKYALRILPVGGFVKLEGEDEASEDPAAFGNKSPLARILVLLSGGLMNIVAGFLIFLILFSAIGQIGVPMVDSVVPGTPAAEAGLMAGDEIIEINGKSVHIQNDVTLAMMKNGSDTLEMTVRRGDEKRSFAVTPRYDAESGSYILGYYRKAEEMTPGLAIKTAYHNTFFVVDLVYYSLREMVTGNVSLRDMSGPVGIVSEMNSVAKSETPVLNMLNFIGLIAVNLGVMNLLPIPALDGGRIFFILVEMIRRKPIRPEHEGIVHFIGFALLILLMCIITFSDIQKIFA
ncbi:MAG: RIP metalloprotease RseP [Clostridia bacterium]|nr:RIP metalloprotease RseP [Clostridia bacterium]